MSDLPTAFADLKANQFPLTVKFWDADTDQLLDTLVIPGPGAVKVPGFAPRRVAVEMIYGDGERIWHDAPPKAR